MQTLQKNEDTWYEILGNFRFRIRFNPESIQRVVAWMIFHTILRNPNGNRYVLYLYRNDDGKWNWNYNWLDNDWNDDNPSACAQLSPFLSRYFLSGEFFFTRLPFQPPKSLPMEFKLSERRMLKRIKDNSTSETINSYLGLLRHGNAFNLKRELLLLELIK